MTEANPDVLLVDDDEPLRETLRHMVAAAGYSVACAPNGRAALELLLEGGMTPSLILLDLEMPEMSGRELVSVLRCYQRLRRIPVLMVTAASVTVGDVHAQLQKPLAPERLLKEIARFLPHRVVG
jgi:CheY-like chemotaxis protein